MGKRVDIGFSINRRWVITVCIVIGSALLTMLTMPLWHWLLFGWLYRHAVGWVVTATLTAAAVISVRKESARIKPRYYSIGFGKEMWLYSRWVLLCVVLLCGYLYFSTDTYGRAVTHSFEPEIVQELPDTTCVRYIPYEVSLAFAQARQENPTKKTGDIDPVEIGGEFFWIAPRIPNGIGNWLFSQTDGVILVSEDGASRFEPQVFKCGEGMAFRHAIAWQLFQTRFAAEYPEIFYLQMEDEWVAMAPYITYAFHFPVFVPKWGGVMLVHPDCVIEDLTPEQAQANPRLEGQRLFPEALAKVYSGSWGYRFGGLGNILWRHWEQVEIPNLEGTENEMPYFVPTTWGPQWMVATEPSGPSQSIFKIFWFDTHSGEAKLAEFAGEGLVGPNRAAGYAKGETPGYTWLEGKGDAQSGTYLAIEPRPIIQEGRLYWQYSVTTQKYTGVGLTILVNSRDTEEVLHFCSRASLTRWLRGEGGPDPVPCTRAGPTAPAEAAPIQPVPTGDLETLTNEELYQLLHQIISELEKRSQ